MKKFFKRLFNVWEYGSVQLRGPKGRLVATHAARRRAKDGSVQLLKIQPYGRIDRSSLIYEDDVAATEKGIFIPCKD